MTEPNDEKRELAIQRILSNARYGAINAVEKDLRELLATPGRAVEGYKLEDVLADAWVAHAYARLGYLRDSMLPTEVLIVQKFLRAASPSPASEPSGEVKGDEVEDGEITADDYVRWCDQLIQQGDNEMVQVAIELKRIKIAAPQPQASAEKVGETPITDAEALAYDSRVLTLDLWAQKYRDLAAVSRRIERELSARREEMMEALGKFIDAVEKLAFSMPAPNTYTPQFVGLCVSARAALHPKAEGP